MNKAVQNQVKAYIKIYFIWVLFYLVFLSLLYIAGGKEFHIRESRHTIEEFPANMITGDIIAGRKIEQIWLNEISQIERVGVMLSNYGKEVYGNVYIELWNEESKELLVKQIINPNEIGFNQYVYLEVGDIQVFPKKLENTMLRLVVSSENGEANMSATALYNSGQEVEEGSFFLNGEEVAGSLCFSAYGKEEVWTGTYYKEIMFCGLLICSLFYWIAVWLHWHGKREPFFSTAALLKKYIFLIEQLVNRDFKVRYKRSVLGIFWSFLNPLLTMTVQYIVFSQLFRSDIENFPLYLLSGLVVFNFFNEAVGQALGSIVYNASLITKVYVPKYIYPVTKVLSSSINFLISMLPLFLVLIVTGEPITKAFIVIPFIMLCVIAFAIGVGMLLSSLMFFFRDIQFLWGIISLLWMYITPIFYPESILSAQYQGIFHYNAMYYYIRFLRKIVIDGVSPEPLWYVQCVACSAAALIIGGLVFQKTQDKFVMNL